jgi:F1F0 ATPase subunit 2
MTQTIMSTHEIAALTLVFFTGVAIGTLFFGGLWWTVLKGIRTRRAALLFLISFLLRTTFVLIAFYLVGTAHLDRLAACLLGFVLGRVLIVRLTRPAMKKGKL